MRSLLFIALLFSTSQAFAQKVAKVIDNCDQAKLVSYLDKGGDINIKITRYDENDQAFEIGLLTYAVHNECLEIVEFLIERKEEIEDYDLELTQAFIYSLSIGNDNVSAYLFKQEPIAHGICDVCHGNNALMVAATYGRDDWYFKLKESSDLKYINASGSNLIHCAASGPSQVILEDVLTISGLDINRKEEDGLTALDYAASNTDNPLAFQTLIEKGADHKQAWNLLYWWSMYPAVPLTDKMIEDRRADVWMIDEEGDNCLLLLSYFFHELEVESGVFAYQLTTVIDIMMEDHKAGKSDLSFVHQFYQNGITMNMLNAMLFIEDFNSDNPVYPKYLEFLGMMCNDAEFCPVYKKEFKTAVKIYGDAAEEWYNEYNIPTE